MREFTPPPGISYADGTGETATDYTDIASKADRARDILHTTLTEYENPAVLWDAGKDSTLLLHYLQQVTEDLGQELPPVIFIDHLQHFHEVHRFIDRWSSQLGLHLVTARNTDLKQTIEYWEIEPGEPIPVAVLSEDNQHQVRNALERDVDEIEFALDTKAGTYLLQTVPFANVITENKFDAVITDDRWDDDSTSNGKTFFSPCHDTPGVPPHDSVHPLLPFTEHEVWEATWSSLVPDVVAKYDRDEPPGSITDLPENLTAPEIPVVPTYFDGYQSVESEYTAEKTGSSPAWEQESSQSTAQDERTQNKEEIERKLRSLGYL